MTRMTSKNGRPMIMAAFVLAVLLTMSTVASQATAAPWTQVFKNDYDLDAIHFWITDGNVTFVSWQQPKNPDPWVTDVFEPTHVAGSGAMIQAGKGSWQVRFSDKTPFTMQWAEILGGIIQGSGSLIYDKGWTSSPDFTMEVSQVSIPTTLLLLGSGFVGLVGIRKTTRPG
jgi:hypothetical protein